ncbi:MAG: hypothetical protein ABSG79_03105 [Bryobacteraceae bacterium]|jgi:hypothetical protein
MDIQLGYWRWRIYRWNEHPNPFLGRPDLALEWLRRFQDDGLAMSELRDLLDGTSLQFPEHRQLLEDVAARISSGELHVCAQASHPYPQEIPDVGLAEEAPMPEVPVRKATPPPPPLPPPESTLPENADAVRIATALQQAAEIGAPFCEECAKLAQQKALAASLPASPPPPAIDNVAIAALMKQAAAEGRPFCEECERARLARKE